MHGGYSGGNTRIAGEKIWVGVALCWIKPLVVLSPLVALGAFVVSEASGDPRPLRTDTDPVRPPPPEPERWQLQPGDPQSSPIIPSAILKGHPHPQTPYISLRPIKNPSGHPFGPGPSFRVDNANPRVAYLPFAVTPISPASTPLPLPQACHTTSKVREKGNIGANRKKWGGGFGGNRR
jgi:hypothetical protein